MRYAILGDIHSNLTALEAVLDSVARDGVDEVLQVGDVVGYGAAAHETIARVRESGMRVVMGNHDGACVGVVDPSTFNDNALIAVRHTLKELTREDRRWLASLPFTHTTDHCVVSHGTLASPERFDYIQRPEDADPSFEILERSLCFLGHTHRPVTLMRLHDSPHRTSYTFEETVDLEDARACLINVGSVGQPRDDDPRAAYAVYDTVACTVTLKRVEYEIEREADRILRAGLPKMLADRLFLGI